MDHIKNWADWVYLHEAVLTQCSTNLLDIRMQLYGIHTTMMVQELTPELEAVHTKLHEDELVWADRYIKAMIAITISPN